MNWTFFTAEVHFELINYRNVLKITIAMQSKTLVLR